MKKENLTSALAAAAAIFAIICLFKINALEDSLDRLQSNILTQTSNLQANVNGLYGQLKSLMEEGESLLSDSGWEYGEADVARREATLVCTVAPKVFSPDSTQALLMVNGETVEMTQSGSGYSVELTLDLFKDTAIDCVMFVDGREVRTELLNWSFAPYRELLPTVYARFEGNGSGSAKDGYFRDGRTGIIEVTVEGKEGGFSLESLDLVYVLDGAETGRKAIDISYAGQKAYIDEIRGSSVPSLPTEEAYINGEYYQLYYYLDTAREIPLGSRLDLYIEAADEGGLRYRALCDTVVIDENGRWGDTEDWYLVGAECTILDADGKVLYSPEH